MTILVDPTAETASVSRQRPVRPPALTGLSVGILDISKARGSVFLDRLDERFVAAGVKVNRYRKPTFARPAPTGLRQQIATEVDLLVEGLAD
ncbi:hypothetical protein AB833_24520 [Chromatiales bacterium (ex Bugula neritina AB1)]|nr:hypothetical protein AB833_24520 [Chromatiales bacterium (ex Bugula neritina AB1)]